MLVLEATLRPVPEAARWQDGWLPLASQGMPSESPSDRPNDSRRQTGGAAVVAFLEAEDSPDGLMQFAREYGYLGVAEPLDQPIHVGAGQTGWAEHIESWRDAKHLLTWANRGWEVLASPDHVKRYVGVRDQGRLAGREVAADPGLRDTAVTGVILGVEVSLQRTLIHGKPRYQRTAWYPGTSVPTSIGTPADLTDTVRAEFLRDSIVALTNEMLAMHCAPQLAIWGGRRAPEVMVAPANLLGQMWLETMLRFAGERRYVRCKGCGRWVDVTDSRISREYCHPPRDAACRKRHQRSR